MAIKAFSRMGRRKFSLFYYCRNRSVPVNNTKLFFMRNVPIAGNLGNNLEDFYGDFMVNQKILMAF